MTYYKQGNYSILLTLPYKIESYENLSSGNWIIKNADSGSVAMAILNPENVSEIGWSYNTFRIALKTQEPILDSIIPLRLV